MKTIEPCILIEWKKLSRSKLPLITLALMMLIPFMGAFFMFILKDPSLAEGLGLISAKAQIMGVADWPSYLSLLSQAIAIGGLFAFGFVTSWIFGREYSDRTIKDLLALPISRNTIVLAKFIVAIIWSLILAIFVLILGLMLGVAINIPGMTENLLREGLRVYIISSSLTILLSVPVGFVASYGRGYLPPLAFIVVSLILAQIVAATGYGEYFPWSIPAIISMGLGGSNRSINKASIVIVLLTSTLGLFATMFWWMYADQD